MKYAKIDSERIVREVIPDFDPKFPGVPVTVRYSGAFLAGCLELADGVEVAQDREYLPLENCFVSQIFYTGTQSMTLAQGETALLPVTFSEAGNWAVVQSGGLETSKTDGALTVAGGEPGTYAVSVAFTETAYGRERLERLSVTVVQAEEAV